MDADSGRKGFDLLAYLKLFRFPLVFTAIADSAAGVLLGERWPADALPGKGTPDILALGCLAASSAGLYFFGMALNDLADVEKDRVSAPGRVLPSGRLSLPRAKGAALGVLIGSLLALYLAGSSSLVPRVGVWCGVVLSIAAYNLFLKLPPVMGLVRGLNLLLGFSATAGWSKVWTGHPGTFAALVLPAFVYVTALTYVSTLEEGMPDRRRVVWGAGGMILGALLASGLLPLCEGGKAFPDLEPRAMTLPPASALLYSLALGAWVVRRAWGARDRRGIMLLVRDGVGGIIVLDAALVASVQGWGPASGVAALAVPAAGFVWVFKKIG